MNVLGGLEHRLEALEAGVEALMEGVDELKISAARCTFSVLGERG